MTIRFFVQVRRVATTIFLIVAALLVIEADVSASVAGQEDLRAARAHWLAVDSIAWAAPDEASVRLHYSDSATLRPGPGGLHGGTALELTRDGIVRGRLAERFPHLAGMPLFRIPADDLDRVPGILRGQFALDATREGALLAATAPQPAGVLDDLFVYDGDLGVTFGQGAPRFRLWAPTARSVTLLLFDDAAPQSAPSRSLPMAFDAASGTWTLDGDPAWTGAYYLYEVEVFVRRTGRFERNRVTDPYSLGLAMDSRRSLIVDLADPALAPEGWAGLAKPALAAPEDIVLYELHVRDFSSQDRSVPPARRGTFLAFTEPDSHGARHLRRLAAAGLSHVHLLPAFDCATVPENPVEQLSPPDLSRLPPDSERQQAEIDRVRARDAFNWCYDPYHYTVPEGSYATDPDGVARIIEYREMVQSLADKGLRLVIDVVYNHTNEGGQGPKSVLDRVVPGYYHRLNSESGAVETSTCCQNTAPEHRMMGKFIADSLVQWADAYGYDGFRFDIMGHHPKAQLEEAREAVRAVDPDTYFYGEGWNFGEVADGARFEQASQLNLGGTEIGSFNDRPRDAVRGADLFVDGGSLQQQDFIRVGLSGTLADYVLKDATGTSTTLSAMSWNGQPAGYAADPADIVNYVSKHDNETLWDKLQYGLPAEATLQDRVRIQNVAATIPLMSQGVPFLQMGGDLIRSKSMDRDSYDSGDWFNRVDFTQTSNNWHVGLPIADKNEDAWPAISALFANPETAVGPTEIQFASDVFNEFLRIRAASPLFRLSTGQDVIDDKAQFQRLSRPLQA